MFKPQFAALVEAATKRQTVRPIPKRSPTQGDTIDARMWMGAPYRSKQRKIIEATITAVSRFEIIAADNLKDYFYFKLNDCLLECDAAEKFAAADGFRDSDAMIEWFQQAHGLPFEGIVIYW